MNNTNEAVYALMLQLNVSQEQAWALLNGVSRSKVRIRSVASPMGRRCIQFCDGVMQSRLTLRVAVCDRHRYIDARRVRRCNRVTPDQGGLGVLFSMR